jgi:hypothetical protein
MLTLMTKTQLKGLSITLVFIALALLSGFDIGRYIFIGLVIFGLIVGVTFIGWKMAQELKDKSQ